MFISPSLCGSLPLNRGDGPNGGFEVQDLGHMLLSHGAKAAIENKAMKKMCLNKSI